MFLVRGGVYLEYRANIPEAELIEKNTAPKRVFQRGLSKKGVRPCGDSCPFEPQTCAGGRTM